MTVTIKVNGTSNSLSHKGAMHFAKNTAPDVCKTPSPGGPVPIPYPVIMSLSSDLAKGTTTVKADGGNMISIKGSEYSRCTGDEPGTAGGVVSSTNMKEATWILYSFDVKMDGGNACRKTDKMKMNHGNTICMSGNDGIDVRVKDAKDFLCDMLCKYGEGTKSSNELEFMSESEVERVASLRSLRLRFRTSFPTPRFKVKKTKPDAVLVDKNGEPEQCFDYKRCTDRERKDEKQRERQTAITKRKRDLIIIDPCTCKCPGICTPPKTCP